MSLSRPLRAACYGRVSTTKEAQSTSIEAQLPVCRRYAEERGWSVVLEAGDRLTGRNEKRPGWQRILAAVEAGAIDVLVVDKRDRVWRNADDFRAFKRRWMADFRVRIEPVLGIKVEPGNIWTEWAEEDEFIAAERFSQRLARVTLEGRMRRLREGYWPTQIPYGCVAGPTKGLPVRDLPASGEPDPDVHSWPWLVAMFERSAEGWSYRRIQTWLTAQGAPPPRGRGWSLQTVIRLLSSPFYIGEFWKEGEVFPLKHECRLPEQLWWSAQGPHVEGRKSGRPRNGEAKYVHLCPRVVCPALEVTAPKHRAGEALPLHAHYTFGRGGVLHPWYYRADRQKIRGLSSSAVPGGDNFDLATTIPARQLDELLVHWLIEGTRDSEQLLVLLEDGAQRRAGEIPAELAEAKRARGRCLRQVNEHTGALTRLAATGLLETLRVLDEALKRERAALAAAEVRVAELTAEAQRLAEAPQSARRAQRRVHLVEELWRAGEYPALADLIRTLVSCVEIHAGHAIVKLKPVCESVSMAALSGMLLYPEKFARRINRAA